MIKNSLRIAVARTSHLADNDEGNRNRQKWPCPCCSY